MQVLFRNARLESLYQAGRSPKGKLPVDLIKRFCLRIQVLEAADSIFDLWKSPSLNLEKMRGHENLFSLRVNDQYRLEFEIEFEDEGQTRGKVSVLNLSDHYGGKKW